MLTTQMDNPQGSFNCIYICCDYSQVNATKWALNDLMQMGTKEFLSCKYQ